MTNKKANFPVKRTDRRVRKTREAIREALMTLIARKGYDLVTVEDIIEKADIGRATFYTHFESKEDVLRTAMGELRKSLSQYENGTYSGEKRLFNFSLELLRHVGGNQALYPALIGKRGGALVLRLWSEFVADLAREDLNAFFGSRDAQPKELLTQFLVGAFISTTMWWVDNGAKEEPEEIDAFFRSLAMSGISTVLKGHNKKSQTQLA
jgi:AcrR family transcriptional regulator